MALLKLSCGFNEMRVFDLFFRESTLDKGKALNDAHHVDQVNELRNSTQQVSKSLQIFENFVAATQIHLCYKTKFSHEK